MRTGSKPPELVAIRFVVATIVCALEVVAYIALVVAMQWRNLGGIIVIALFWAALGATWRIVSGESFAKMKATKRYRKFFQNQLYDDGFVAGRDGKKWDELDTQIREHDDYYRGFMDGTGYKLATRNKRLESDLEN